MNMPSKQIEAVRRRREASSLSLADPAFEAPDDESWGDLTAEPRQVDYLETGLETEAGEGAGAAVTADGATMTDRSAEFAERTEPFRRELLAHCYRMLGSADEASAAGGPCPPAWAPGPAQVARFGFGARGLDSAPLTSAQESSAQEPMRRS